MHRQAATSPTLSRAYSSKTRLPCAFTPLILPSPNGHRLEDSSSLRLIQLGLLALPLTGESDTSFLSLLFLLCKMECCELPC